MNKAFFSLAATAAMLVGAPSVHAVVYTFNASLSGANEVLVSGGPGSGIAILAYDTMGTASLLDDNYDFAMSVFGLSGGLNGKAANAFHIHGAATTAENGPVRVALDAGPFVALNSGSTLLVGGSDVAAPVFDTGNGSYPVISFLDMLRGGLTYVNVHTSDNPGGAVRGQLIEVSAVPEPSTYAMLLAGLGVVGLLAHRRRG